MGLKRWSFARLGSTEFPQAVVRVERSSSTAEWRSPPKDPPRGIAAAHPHGLCRLRPLRGKRCSAPGHPRAISAKTESSASSLCHRRTFPWRCRQQPARRGGSARLAWNPGLTFANEFQLPPQPDGTHCQEYEHGPQREANRRREAGLSSSTSIQKPIRNPIKTGANIQAIAAASGSRAVQCMSMPGPTTTPTSVPINSGQGVRMPPMIPGHGKDLKSDCELRSTLAQLSPLGPERLTATLG